MIIESLSLYNFRNFERLSFAFNSDVNIFYGKNAAGKTNILEALSFCATGRSYRASNDKELIRFHEKEAHIQLFVKKGTRTDRIDIHLKKDGKKGIAVNGIVIKKLSELFGTLYVVIFSPEDLDLLKGSPAERRRFIDLEICQLSVNYYYDLQQYHRVLKQRNNLLKRLQANKENKQTLIVWDEQLVSYGKRVIDKRMDYVSIINQYANEKHRIITDGKENLLIQYSPCVDKNNFADKLAKSIDKDIHYGNTSYGPHKDDLDFFINGFDVKIYGSQGQQRTAALSLKMSEIDVIKTEKNTSPVLLLDDVLSELDTSRQKKLIENIKDIQMIITCTGIDDVLKKYKKQQMIYLVENETVVIV